MNELVCNYSTVRFLPYRETGEFVNLGVVIYCPEIDWFDFRLENRRTKRVHGFFPELDLGILRSSIAALELTLNRRRTATDLQLYSARIPPKDAQSGILRFQELIRLRESLLHFGEPKVLLVADPRDALNKLFHDLVRRQFALPKEYNELVMRKRLSALLRAWSYHYEVDHAVGDDEYRIRLPFVHLEDDRPVKALKPFDLDRSDTSDIYTHGDAWISKIERLAERSCLPAETVFAVKFPAQRRRLRIAQSICNELRNLNVKIVEFSNRDSMREAAFVG